MKNLLKKIIKKTIFASIYFISISSYGYSENNIYYIDINVLLEETIYGKKIINEITEKNNQNIKYLNEKEKKLKEKETKIIQTQNVTSESKFNENINELKFEIDELLNEKKKLFEEYEIFKQKKINDFFIKAKPLIENYMKEKSINILLDKKNIFMGNLDNEITLDIVKVINKLN